MGYGVYSICNLILQAEQLFFNPLALLCQKAGLDGLSAFPRYRGDTASVKQTGEKKKAAECQDSCTLQASSLWLKER